jgi:dipeptidyl aminopeptidase/acylaminoacyl peptidase
MSHTHFERAELRSRALRATLAVLVVAAFAGCQAAPEPAPARPQTRYEAATFFETLAIRGGSFSADETRILLSNDSSGTFDVYALPVAGGDPTPQHASPETDLAVSYFPADDRFLFSADQGGNELTHLYVRELDGSVRDLTPGERLKAEFLGWSGDDRGFWVISNERDPRYFDVYRYAADDYARELVFRNEEYFPGDVSRDGRYLALTKLHSNVHSDVFLHDFQSGETRQVTPAEGDVEHRAMGFTPDSKELYFTSNAHGEFVQVWSHDLTTGEQRPVVQANWDVMYVSHSENGRYRVTAINEDATTRLEVLDTASGEPVVLPSLSGADVQSVSFSPSESKMLLRVASDTSPMDLYLVDLAATDHTPRQLTRALSTRIDRADLVEADVVRFASYDGLEIPGVLYRPLDATPENKAPAMLWMHGGPGGQSRVGYSAAIQHLVNHGYAIFAVNNRGSSGYGKTFFHLDDRRHGEADLGDCVAARGYLESLDWIDGERIGIMGGSYGGYLVAAALAFQPEVFDVGIDIFGVTNWLRTLESMPPWWTAQRKMLYDEMGDPATDRERLHRISPLFHAANITKPLLVVQGANDPRVLQVESDELVAAVRANGVPVEYVVFPDEGHGFSKKENQIAASQAYLEFLEQHLRGAGVAAATPSDTATAP